MGMESYSGQTLVVAEGPHQGASYPLQGTVVTLGRATDNSIVLDSGNISRYHAQIRLSSTGTLIEDLGSTNGTWVNNHRIFAPQPLMHGDVIRLADFVTFRYVVAQYADATSRMDPNVRRQPTEQDFEVDQPGARAYESSDYVEPYVSPPSISPDYAPPPRNRANWEAYDPASIAATRAPAEKQQPKWLYVVIGLLVVVLCLCVATAVYIWFAPREFWDWLFDLFNIAFPNACLPWLIGLYLG
jgi:hypothetical protein